MIEEALPASRALQEVVHTTLNCQREVVLLAIVSAGAEQHREVSFDGRSRLFGGGVLRGLVDRGRRRRIGVGRGRDVGARRRQVLQLRRLSTASHRVSTGNSSARRNCRKVAGNEKRTTHTVPRTPVQYLAPFHDPRSP